MIEKIEVEHFKGTTGILQLDPKRNLLLGKSGSGKSTWLEAARVGLLGYEPALGKQPGSTMTLASGEWMEVRIYTPDLTIERKFTSTATGAKQTIKINEKAVGLQEATEEIQSSLYGSPALLNLDEFSVLSDDKKAAFFFELSDLGSGLSQVRRKVVYSILESYTPAVKYICEYDIGKPLSDLNSDELELLAQKTLDKIEEEHSLAVRTAVWNVIIGMHSVEAENGQELLENCLTYVNDEVKILRRKKNDALATNRSLVSSIAKEGEDRCRSIELVESDLEDVRQEISRIESEVMSTKRVQASYERQVEAIQDAEKKIDFKKKTLADLENVLTELPESEEEATAVSELLDNQAKEIADMKTRLSEMLEEDTRIQSEIVEVKTKIDTISGLREKLEGVDINCPKCKAEFPAIKGAGKALNIGPHKNRLASLESKDKQLKSDLNTIRDEMEDLQKESTDTANRLTEIKKLLTKRMNAEATIETIKAEIEEWEGSLNKLKQGFEKQEAEVDIEDYEQQLEGLRTRLNSLQTEKEQAQDSAVLMLQLEQKRMEVKKLDAMWEVTKQAEKAIKAVRNNITNDLTGPLEEAANKMLAAVDPSLKLTYRIGERNQFEVLCVNLQGKEVHFSSLSGGEKILYSAAQMLAFAKAIDPPLQLLQSELGELSGDMVAPFLRSVEKMTEDSNVQAMFASCHQDFEQPESWNVVTFA